MKQCILIAIIGVAVLFAYGTWCNRADNGVHGLGKNVCLIEGECIVINWDATPQEAERALDAWWKLRNK